MALSNLDNLYRQVILDHSSHSHHHGHLENTNYDTTMFNPTCGDVLKIEVEVVDNKIKDIAFSGNGCTISQASASMMTDTVINKDVSDAIKIADTFINVIVHPSEYKGKDLSILEDAETLTGVAQFPARVKCATLAWKGLKKALLSNNGTGVVGQVVHHEDD